MAVWKNEQWITQVGCTYFLLCQGIWVHVPKAIPCLHHRSCVSLPRGLYPIEARIRRVTDQTSSSSFLTNWVFAYSQLPESKESSQTTEHCTLEVQFISHLPTACGICFVRASNTIRCYFHSLSNDLQPHREPLQWQSPKMNLTSTIAAQRPRLWLPCRRGWRSMPRDQRTGKHNDRRRQ